MKLYRKTYKYCQIIKKKKKFKKKKNKNLKKLKKIKILI